MSNQPSSGSNVALVILVVAMLFLLMIGVSHAEAGSNSERLRHAIIADGYRCDEIYSVRRPLGFGNRMIVVCSVMAQRKVYHIEFFRKGVFITPAR